MSQPVLGIVATAVVIALSLGYIAAFDFGTFVGWVSFFMLCLIPAQVVTVVLSPNPAFAARLRQPARGLALLISTIAAAVIITPMVLQVVGEGVAPPGPIPSQFAVIAVPTAFLMAIMFSGWPFTAVTKNSVGVALLVLVSSYVVTYLLFRAFFNYDFLQGTPVYLESAPSGAYNGVTALVFYVTVLAGMFLMLHFDLWPLTTVPGVMKQPALGVVWLLAALIVAVVVMQVATGSFGLDPMYVLTRITAPFIFGTIIVLNMLQNSVFARLRQPVKGVANTLAAAVVGVALGQVYGMVAPAIAGPLPSGAPGYEYELWLVNALLSVTFPFLIFHAVYFGYWPLSPAAAPAPAEAART